MIHQDYARAYHTGWKKKTLHLHLPGGIDAEIRKSIGLDDVNENKKQNKLHLRNCTNKISSLPCTGKQARYIAYVSIICKMYLKSIEYL